MRNFLKTRCRPYATFRNSAVRSFRKTVLYAAFRNSAVRSFPKQRCTQLSETALHATWETTIPAVEWGTCCGITGCSVCFSSCWPGEEHSPVPRVDRCEVSMSAHSLRCQSPEDRIEGHYGIDVCSVQTDADTSGRRYNVKRMWAQSARRQSVLVSWDVVSVFSVINTMSSQYG